jgi:photosystem II stability/assembly factor-like uncharacterized protein
MFAIPACIAVLGSLVVARPSAAQETTVSALSRQTHFHGIAVARDDPSRLILATHHGLYVVSPDGTARLASKLRHDFMGFTPHPSNPATLYASGHPGTGGNLGFITSTDRGETWTKLSDGVDGPVDFHQMDVSKADPNVIYGVHGGLQRSADGGKTWRKVGPAPEGMVALATSTTSADTLFAATTKGLFNSADGGKTWRMAHILMRPVSMVHVTGRGEVYAFILGSGLVRAAESAPNWETVSNGFGEDYVLHLADDPNSRDSLYVVTVNAKTHSQAVLHSRDGGRSWRQLGSGAG